MVPPACSDDAISLTNVLSFVNQILELRDFTLWDSAYKAVKINLQCLLEVENINKDISGHILDDLVTAVLKFMKLLSELSPPDKLLSLHRNSLTIPILMRFIFNCFSKKQKTLQDRQHRILSLRLLLVFTIHSEMIQYMEPSVVCELIGILVKAFGALHQSLTSIDHITYQDRTTYLLLGKCIRNVSRLVLNVYVQNEWVW